MASPTTTHVIEIETGIGEPAFVPLALGQELQPISVGKKGMWRIESPRVLEVHAFVYFDGHSLFVQSADEANPATVDGVRVGKAWTELHAPCKIDIGLARLRFRSLIANDKESTEISYAPPPPMSGAPGSGPTRPGASMPVAVAVAPPPPRVPRTSTGPRPATMAEPPAAADPPLTFPKVDRPFKPGEFSSPQSVDESTRVAPLDATGGGRMASRAPAAGSGSAHTAGKLQVQGPMAEGGPQPPAPGPSASYAQSPPPRGYEPGHPPHPAQPPPAYASHPPPYGPQPHGPGGGVATGGYGSMTPQGGVQPPRPAAAPAPGARLKQASIPLVVLALLAVIGGSLYLLRSDDSSRLKPLATLDSGTQTATPGVSATPVVVSPPAQAWPPGVACPPPNWPPNTPLPCTPNGVSPSATAAVDPRVKESGRPKDSKDPGGAKSLERQAVDFVAAGETAKAASAYDDLVRRDPTNKVYAEAARILRAKLDAGAL